MKCILSIIRMLIVSFCCIPTIGNAGIRERIQELLSFQSTPENQLTGITGWVRTRAHAQELADELRRFVALCNNLGMGHTSTHCRPIEIIHDMQSTVAPAHIRRLLNASQLMPILRLGNNHIVQAFLDALRNAQVTQYEIQELLTYTNTHNNTVLFEAIISGNSTLVETLLQLPQEFSLDPLIRHRMLLYTGNLRAHIFTHALKSPWLMPLLLNIMLESGISADAIQHLLTQVDPLGRTILTIATDNGNPHAITHCIKLLGNAPISAEDLSTLLYHSWGKKTPLMTIVHQGDAELVNAFFSSLQALISNEALRTYLHHTIDGESALTMATPYTIDALTTWIKSIEEEEIMVKPAVHNP